MIPTLIRPLSLKGYIFWTYDLYDVSIDGEHQEEQPGRRELAAATPYHHGATDDDANPIASADGSEHAEYGEWEWECTPSSQRQKGRVSEGTSACLQAFH